MPVFCNLRKGLTFRRIQNSDSDFRLIFENPSHFSAIFCLRNMKISLRNFRISLRNFEITLSNPKIFLLDFHGVKIFAEISQFCVLFCQKSRVKTFYFFVKIFRNFPSLQPCAYFLQDRKTLFSGSFPEPFCLYCRQNIKNAVRNKLFSKFFLNFATQSLRRGISFSENKILRYEKNTSNLFASLAHLGSLLCTEERAQVCHVRHSFLQP